MKGKSIFFIVLLLALAGLVFSYMALDLHIGHIFNPEKSDSYCNISAAINCDAVIESDWSVLFNRPIALYGVFFYLALGLFSMLCIAIPSVSRKSKIDALLAIAVLAVFDSLFLLAISIFEIKTVCPVCAGVYLVNFLLFFVLWFSDRSAGLLARITTGFLNLILAPIRLLTVWFTTPGMGSKMFALLSLVVLFGSVFAAEESFYGLAKYRRDSLVEQKLDLPWPKEYTLPDTFRIDQGAWGDYYLGDPEAPIKIVEMFDYECGHCRFFYGELKPLLAQYEGKYLLILKNYPLDQSCNASMPHEGHKNACYAALLARCAGEQGMFHEMSDFILTADIFGRDVPQSVTRAGMDKGIELFGLDETELRACMADDRQLDQIKADIKLGDAIGIQGTPTVWINGKKLPGVDQIIVKRVFDDILSK